MGKKHFFSLVFVITLLGLVVASTRVQKVRAPYPIITIEADGSINPPTTITSLDNVTYSFTADVNACIVVKRSNIVIDGNGYTLSGVYGPTPALNLTNVINVTISELIITGFGWGICIESSHQNIISNNNLTQNEGSIWVNSSIGNKITSNTIANTIDAILLSYSNDNVFLGNNMSDIYGVYLEYSADNIISENNINSSQSDGVKLTQSSNNTISLNTVENCNYYGIFLTNSSDNLISNNRITSHDMGGIRLYSSWDNMVSGNEISAKFWGIDLSASTHNTLSGNNVTGNVAGISVRSALVNSVIVGSNNNIISANNIVKNTNGIDAVGANFTSIFGNNLTSNSQYGITFDNAGYNTVIMNSITNNSLGIFIEGTESIGSVLYHNNIIDNTIQVELQITYPLAWDSGFEGNYWSNFAGVDSNHDGISDTGLAIGLDSINVDHFPLMGPFHSFNTSQGYTVDVISNSTINDFEYFESNSTIRMHVSNMTSDQTFGFCRVRIPHTLMNQTVPITVLVNGTEPYYWNYTLYDDGNNKWMYFKYEHSTLEIVIIPEFPSLIILSLFMTLSLLATVTYRRRYVEKV